ncbi:MAG: Do family serine endopeptidase [Pseudomonadota bacterium]
MTKTFFTRKVLMVGIGGVALGALASPMFGSFVNAQEMRSEAVTSGDTSGPKEAKPKLKAPDVSVIPQFSFADLVEEVSPAVVSVRTEAEVPVARRSLPPGFERFLPPEFRGFEDGEGEGPTRRAMGEGSGFFIDDKGHIVTNNHVIDDAKEITIVLDNGKELIAELIGTDPSTDLAVLKVDPSSEQRYVKFSTDADLRVGDYVLAVGNPFGLGGSVTSGIVSAIGRENRLSRTPYADFIQIDASINRGNSGGPTFDLSGNVVGVNTAIISPTGGNVGIGLAVPAEIAASVVRELIENGSVTRGWLGVSISDLDERLAVAVGLEDAEGALVQNVQPGSPAEKAGLKQGDVVLEFGGKKVGSSAELTRIVGDLDPGSKVNAKIFRDDKERNVRVTLTKRDNDVASLDFNRPQTPSTEEEKTLLGVTFSSLDPASEMAQALDENESGIMVSDVDKGSEAEDAGFRSGMIVTRADNQPVKAPEDIEKIVKAAKKRGKEAVLVRIQIPGGAGGSFLALPIAEKKEG